MIHGTMTAKSFPLSPTLAHASRWLATALFALCSVAWGVEPPHYTLGPSDLGVVINSADPYSRDIGAYYAKAHNIPPENVVEIDLPVKDELTAQELDKARTQLQSRLGNNIQALALVWAKPWHVGCASITYAITVGYDAGLCKDASKPTPLSNYFNSMATRPWQELGLRPSMLVAANSEAQAQKLIDRGVAAWGNHPHATAWFVQTSDKFRNPRAQFFPADQYVAATGVTIKRVQSEGLKDQSNILLYQTGRATVDNLNTLGFVPGALADHLTSFGGVISGNSGQMSSLKWLEAGATATYGSVSEPYSYPQKFPHPQILLLHYMAGATAVEAYWKSVAWPAQGLFLGDPLAAPYRRLGPYR